jgi:hypothetical protein
LTFKVRKDGYALSDQGETHRGDGR